MTLTGWQTVNVKLLCKLLLLIVVNNDESPDVFYLCTLWVTSHEKKAQTVEDHKQYLSYQTAIDISGLMFTQQTSSFVNSLVYRLLEVCDLNLFQHV